MDNKYEAIRKLAVMIIVVLLTSGSTGFLITDAYGEGSGDFPPPESGDWIITSQTNVTDETLYLNGNIFIRNGGTLHLENVHLIFNSTRNGEFRLDVESGGVLYFYNSTTNRGTDFTYGFRLLDGGKMRIENSEIRRCGYNAWNYYGLTLYGNDAIIRNTLFTQNNIGIYSYVAEGHEITGNSFINNSHVAVYLHTVHDFLVSDNLMDHNNYGGYYYSSFDGMVERNTVRNNSGFATRHGIMVRNCNNIMIRDNVVNDTAEALYTHTSTNITFLNNQASNSTRGIRSYSSQHITVQDNILFSNAYGIYADYNAVDLTILDNIVSFSKSYNMYLYRASGSRITGNDIKNVTVYYGLALRECSEVEVNDNIITGNKDRGLWFWDSNNLTATSNTISGSNIGFYGLRSKDNTFADGDIQHNNYGIYFDGCTRNVIENSSSLNSNNQDIHLRGGTAELLLLNSIADTRSFHDEASEFTERFYLDVEFQGRTGPVSGVDVEVTEMLTDTVIYASPGFGGTDERTDDAGLVRWITPLYSVNNKAGSTLCQVRIRVNDHGIYQEEWYGYVEQQKTMLFTKSALTVDKAGNGDYTTIGEAVAAASDGDHILVTAGSYQENIIIDKALEIYGKGGQVIIDASGGTGFVTQGTTTLANMSIINSTTDIDVQANTQVYNLSFTTSNLDATYYLAVGYYLDLHTVDDNQDPIAEANVTVRNWFLPQRQYYSDPYGLVENIPLLDYADTSSQHWDLNPYSINATAEFLSGGVILNIHSNMEHYLNLTRHGGFGSSIVSGDLNNDGFEDYVVGAPNDDQGGKDAGAVFIFYGPNVGVEELRPIDADTVLVGEQAASLFGTSLAMGDINDDGLPDLLAGSPAYNSTDIHGIKGWYYDEDDFTGFEYTRIDSNINFAWGDGNPGGLGREFSVTWEGFLNVEKEDDYTFYFEHDDGVKFSLDGDLLFERNNYSPDEEQTAEPIHLTTGMHSIEIEYFDSGGGAKMILKWGSPNMAKEIIPPKYFFYEEKQEIGNGTVYLFPGELFVNGEPRTIQATKIEGNIRQFGRTLSMGDVNMDAMDDIFIGFQGGTGMYHGSPMIYKGIFEEQPLLSDEWDPVIKGNGGDMYLSGDGDLVIDSYASGDAYVYAMSKNKFLDGFSFRVELEEGSNAPFLDAIDFKVLPEDNSSKQVEGTLFSLKMNGEIFYYTTPGGALKSANPNVDDRFTFEVRVSDGYTHLTVLVDDEIKVDTPLSGWHPVYLKLGDSSIFGAAERHIYEYTPLLAHKDMMGVEKAVYLNNTERKIAVEIFNATYLFEPDLDNYFTKTFGSMSDFQGSYNYTEFRNGLTLYPYKFISIVPNGDFDDGWENWTQTENIRDKNNGDWEITTEAHGDWHIYHGPTAGLGPEGAENVNHQGGNGKNCDGLLVSDPFLVPDGVKLFDFWCHVEWWSFEYPHQNNYQDDIADAINIRLYLNSTNDIIAEKIYSNNVEDYGGDGEEEGRLQFDISAYQGETLRFEVELVNNYREHEDGIVQIDNITGAKEKEELEGDFISELIDLNRTFSAFVPTVHMDEYGGNITFFYRTNESEDWTEMNGGMIELSQPETTFQYRVVLEGVKGNPYPVVEYLYFTFYDQTPVSLQSGYPVDVGAIIEEHTLGVVNGNTLTLYEGEEVRMNITSDKDITAVTLPGDVDINGQEDIIISSNDTAYIFLSNDIEDRDVKDADYLFSGEVGYGLSLHKTLVGSPLELAGDGRAYVLPMFERNFALVSVNLEDDSLIYPHTGRTLKPIVVNTGLLRLEDVGLKLEITAPSYSHEETIRISLDPGEAAEVPFVWVIPEDEGVSYTIVFTLDPDMDDRDDVLELTVTTRYHALTLETGKEYDAVARNGTASYSLVLSNTGTLGEDNVTFKMDLPGGWDWWTSRGGVNFTSILITDRISFDLFVRTSSPLGMYPVTLTAVSGNATANATEDLEVHIVDRDITPIQVAYLREDGKEGTPVSGENTTIVLTLQNVGTESVSAFNTTLYLDDEPILAGAVAGIPANNVTTISFHVVLLEGSHTLRFAADERDEIREYNEQNNDITSPVDVKPEISSVLFLFRVHVVDLEGSNFTGARIRISSGSNILENVTNDNGTCLLSIQSYPEGEVYLVEAVSGELYASVNVAVYSEDLEAVVELVVGRYSFLLTCDSRDREIAPGGIRSYTINITDTGDFGDNYSITLGGLPELWDAVISGSGYDDGLLTLGKDVKTTLTVTLTSWQYAPAHQRYELTFTAASLVSPAAVKDLILRATVTVNENITLYTEMPEEHGLPKDPISHRVFVNNSGNAEREITLIMTGDVEYSSLTKYSFTLLPGEFEEVLFIIIIPNLRAGSILNHELYGIITGVGTTPSIRFTTTIDASSGEYMDAAILGMTLTITNNGNTRDHISITTRTALANITLLPTSLDIDMGETAEVEMEVEMIDLTIPAGSYIQVFVSLYNGNRYFINSTRNMLVPEVYDLSLDVENSPLKAPPGTQASFKVLVKNLGNIEQRVFFSGTIDGDEPLQLPAPILLSRHQELYVYPSVQIPDDAHGKREISLTAVSRGLEVTIDLALNLSVAQEIVLQEISARAYEGGTKYTINLVNSGEIDEVVRIEASCGELDLEVAEVPADDYVQFHLLVTDLHFCPDTITINARSDKAEGVTSSLELVPPPFVTIQIRSTLPATVSEPVILEASGDYSSYLWTIDGKSVLGREIYYNFSSSGLHQVELTVRDDRAISTVFIIDVLVENTPPVIEIEPSFFGNSDDYIDLDARESYDPDGTITEFRWIIENKSYFGPDLHYLFRTGGSYTITLQVTDNEGAVSTKDVLVTIRDTGKEEGGTIEKEELDMQLVGISSALLLVLIGLIAFMFFRMNKEENTMLQKLIRLESMKASTIIPEVVAEVVSEPGAPGHRNCPKCGHHVPGNFRFCNKCGSGLDPVRGPEHGVETFIFCTECGAKVPAKFRFCNKCGSTIDHEEVAS